MTTVTAPIQLHKIEPRIRRGLEDIVERVVLKSVVDGRGKDLLLRVYIAGLYHGAELAPASQKDASK